MQTPPSDTPSPLFRRLLVLDQRATPGAAAWNMAADEALLEAIEETGAPVLRFYRWASPALSFGCFLKYEDALAAALPGETLVRRRTGGGMVHHGADFTWSLIVPRAHPFAKTRPAESYVRLHEALAAALKAGGVEEALVVPAHAAAPRDGLCFQAPAPGDLLWRGQKIAGAGQRRTRQGFLHQASVQGNGLTLPEHFGTLLANALAEEATPFSPPEEFTPDAAFFENETWLRRR